MNAYRFFALNPVTGPGTTTCDPPVYWVDEECRGVAVGSDHLVIESSVIRSRQKCQVIKLLPTNLYNITAVM